MFSYSDSVFQTSNSPTKEVSFEQQRQQHQQHQHQQHHQLQHPQQQPYHSNDSNNGPLYPYNDMLYSIDNHQQMTSLTYDIPSHNIQNHFHQQQDHHQRWQESSSQQQQQQHTHNNSNNNSSSFFSELQQQQQPQLVVDHSSPYDAYNTVSPFSSPIPNNNVLMANTSSTQSLQSLPSVPPIPSSTNSPSLQQQQQSQRPRITTSLWDDEGTVCYQVDVRGICVARRQDNDMVNGTKLLNVTGMSRGKRDGILKNEKGRVVVKVGAMHLKGVWVTFARAKALAIQFSIADHLHPLFVDDPAMYFYSNQLTPHNYFIPNHPIYLQSQDSFTTSNHHSNNNNSHHHHLHQRSSPSNSSTTASVHMTANDMSSTHSNVLSNNNHSSHDHYLQTATTAAPTGTSMLSFSAMFPNNSNSNNNTTTNTNTNTNNLPHSTSTTSQGIYHNHLPSAPPVPSMTPVQQTQMSMYGYATNNNNNSNNNTPFNNNNNSNTQTPTTGIDVISHFS